MAVEATGYALLTMFKVEGGGVTIIQDQVGGKDYNKIRFSTPSLLRTNIR
jgi:hypothetical protein